MKLWKYLKQKMQTFEDRIAIANLNLTYKDLLELESLNNKIGYVSQKAVIFDGTVSSNVNFGKSKKRITKKLFFKHFIKNIFNFIYLFWC